MHRGDRENDRGERLPTGATFGAGMYQASRALSPQPWQPRQRRTGRKKRECTEPTKREVALPAFLGRREGGIAVLELCAACCYSSLIKGNSSPRPGLTAMGVGPAR